MFRGLSASMVGMLHACVYFPIYERLKAWFNKDEKKLKSFQVFICAIISKGKEHRTQLLRAQPPTRTLSCEQLCTIIEVMSD